ncbi:MAG: hypothetical protein L0I76_26210 [Pseudonocardia sp.]|nr:hypothetical protein [Pseudonocardia sp.]
MNTSTPAPRPTEADTAVARALHTLRPAALPWHALAYAAHQNLARDASRLRAALEREGWTHPTTEVS